MPLQSRARALQTTYRARDLTSVDVVAAAYPKSGSTWLRFIVADLAPQREESDFSNIGNLSAPLGGHKDAPKLIDGVGRFIKTHESYSSFRNLRSRALYMVRDGRDVAVSMFHFLRRRNVYSGSFNEYLSAYLSGRVVSYGSWQDHVTSWYSAQEKMPAAVAVLRYEDLLGPQGAGALTTALSGIGWRIPPEAARAAVARNELENMKKKESAAQSSAFPGLRGQAGSSVPFVRSGRAGQWREVFTEAQARQFHRVAGHALEAAGYGD